MPIGNKAPPGSRLPERLNLVGQHRELKAGWLWLHFVALNRAREAGGPSAVLVYLALCAREGKTPPAHKAAFKASACNIASECGLSTRTVQRMLPLLVQAKLVEMKSGWHSGKQASHVANTYRLLELPHATESRKPCDNENARDGAHKRNSHRKVRKKVAGSPSADGLTASAGAADSEQTGDGHTYEWR